jgi:hypothetical protein
MVFVEIQIMPKTSLDYPYRPVNFTDVTIEDNFWLPRIETNRKITIPYDFQMCEETGRINNFLKAAGKMDGIFEGLWFNDSDVFKVIEGASYALQVHPDTKLENHIDSIIEKIGAAQEEDGYLYTARTIDPANPPPQAGAERWSNLYMSHELYNLGHMYEAGVAYYHATGKSVFLDICIRSANLITEVFGSDTLHAVPGHQEIEIGLVKLYRVTGNSKYLDLVKFFLDERGHSDKRKVQYIPNSLAYMQDHKPILEQDEAVGHAVRATYMYSGIADIAALTGDVGYTKAIQLIWDNVVQKKLALTGGIGARHSGEAFGDAYELPNARAYNETCAAIGNIFWNHRMYLLQGDPKYYDILERSLYNGFLSGISLEGNSFFYVNPLEFDGKTPFNSENSMTRQAWFNCSCCPTNVVRLLPSLSGYIYAFHGEHLYINMYIASQTQVEVAGHNVKIAMQTNYPWDGQIKVEITLEQATHFTLSLRIPCWLKGKALPDSDLYRYMDDTASEYSVKINGIPLAVTDASYINIEREWLSGDIVELDFSMPIRRVIAHPNIETNIGKVALERGPIVYAAEAIDNNGQALNIILPDDMPLKAEHRPDLLNGITTITGQNFMAIPYYAWGHRGLGEMAVWLNRKQ